MNSLIYIVVHAVTSVANGGRGLKPQWAFTLAGPSLLTLSPSPPSKQQHSSLYLKGCASAPTCAAARFIGLRLLIKNMLSLDSVGLSLHVGGT